MRLVFAFAFVLMTACASAPEEPLGNPHQATNVNDLFQVEQGMPMREVHKQPFFPKTCEVVGRRPYFSKTEYECTEGP